MKNYYILNKKQTATAHKKMNNETVKRLWHSFMLNSGDIELDAFDAFIFKIGNTEAPLLESDSEYALTVDADGICIVGKNYGGLMRGFYSLLLKFEYENGEIKIAYTDEQSSYKISRRMIHICVFPENDLNFIKRLIRLSALCQYTHIIIEFWGMLKYDCLNELAYPSAFTKREAGELISECRNLGLEPIPMFNQLGHASASRVCYGKHVVLDQNPALQELFTPDGWAWNIKSDKVFKLLKQVRCELYELFGECEYIHIGCDEAYYIDNDKALRDYLPTYLKKLTEEVVSEGKRPMLWMDMLLEEGKFSHCYTTGKADEVEVLRNCMPREAVFVDWQYDCTDFPIPSLASLSGCGHDCMGAPWFNGANYSAHIATVCKNQMYGIMLTTWHTLKEHMPSILGCAKLCGAKSFIWSKSEGNLSWDGALCAETATLMRKVSFENYGYESYGWAKQQIEV